MVKRLTKHGNSLALVIDRPILELLKITADTPLSVTTDGKNLLVSRAADEREEKEFRAAYAKVKKRYAPALKRLAE